MSLLGREWCRRGWAVQVVQLLPSNYRTSRAMPSLAGSLTLFLSHSEPIQSRCAVLRYTKLTDAQVLTRLMNVIEKENVPYTDDGLEAIIFTAQGDMRQVCALAVRRHGPPGLAMPLF